MRRGFVEGGKDGSHFVRVAAAILDMEIEPYALRQGLCSGLVVCIDVRTQALHVVPRCPFQRSVHQVYGRLDPFRKAATNPLVNTEDNAMSGRIDKPGSENISNAACQHKI